MLKKLLFIYICLWSLVAGIFSPTTDGSEGLVPSGTVSRRDVLSTIVPSDFTYPGVTDKRIRLEWVDTPTPLWEIPGIEHLYRGFDIVKGEGCTRPLFQLTYKEEKKIQDTYRGRIYLVPDQMEVAPKPQCQLDVSSKFHKTASDLAKSLSIGIGISANAQVKVVSAGMQASAEVRMARRESRSGEKQIARTEAKCLSFETVLVDKVLHPAFVSEVKRIPQMTPEQKKEFILQFGTHYWLRSGLGGRLSQMSFMEKSAIKSVEEMSMMLAASFSASVSIPTKGGGGGGVSGRFGKEEMAAKMESKGVSQTTILSFGGAPGSFGGAADTPSTWGDWAQTTDQLPVIIAGKLHPIADLLGAIEDQDGQDLKKVYEGVVEEYLGSLTDDSCSDKCDEHGSCISFQCVCDIGWKGPECTEPIQEYRFSDYASRYSVAPQKLTQINGNPDFLIGVGTDGNVWIRPHLNNLIWHMFKIPKFEGKVKKVGCNDVGVIFAMVESGNGKSLFVSEKLMKEASNMESFWKGLGDDNEYTQFLLFSDPDPLDFEEIQDKYKIDNSPEMLDADIGDKNNFFCIDKLGQAFHLNLEKSLHEEKKAWARIGATSSKPYRQIISGQDNTISLITDDKAYLKRYSGVDDELMEIQAGEKLSTISIADAQNLYGVSKTGGLVKIIGKNVEKVTGKNAAKFKDVSATSDGKVYVLTESNTLMFLDGVEIPKETTTTTTTPTTTTAPNAPGTGSFDWSPPMSIPPT